MARTGAATSPLSRMTPAQGYCLAAGAVLLLAGILGFVAESSFDVADDLARDSFIGFDVNGWHNVVHILSGVVLLAAFPRRASAKAIAIAFGVVYGLVAIIGLIDGDDVFGLIPVNAADNILHIALAALGIVAGLASRGDEDVRGARRDDRIVPEGDRQAAPGERTTTRP